MRLVTMAKVALITGAARRVGAVMTRYLHAKGMNIVIHYHRSEAPARKLQQELNSIRPDSVAMLAMDLADTQQLPQLIDAAAKIWGQLDALLNNASSFYPTPMG